MTDLELLRRIRDGLVHRSSDGRAWLAVGAGFDDVTVQADALWQAGMVWFERNRGGWWAVYHLRGPGEQLVGVPSSRRQAAAELTEADARLAVRLYSGGESMRRTARTLQTSERKIREILAAAGVQLRRTGRPVNREAAPL